MRELVRTLIVEDSEDDALLIINEIKKGGYEVYYEKVETATSMTIALNERKWDIVLSDYSMPHFNGIKALEVLKKSGIDIPFIIISGLIGEEVAVEVMKAGAHDYIMKNNLKCLLPTIEREIRKSKIKANNKQLKEKLKETEFLELTSRQIEAKVPFQPGWNAIKDDKTDFQGFIKLFQKVVKSQKPLKKYSYWSFRYRDLLLQIKI